MWFLYQLFIRLLIAGMRIGAIFNYKLKKGLAGRRQSCEIVQSNFAPDDHIIWMHAASLGEYEQGLPVLEKLKENFPDHKILITFFSPSGYDHVITKHNIADAICYLPFDTEKWVAQFTANFKTDIFITVKYDFWYQLLTELRKQGAQIYVVSALFYETQVFFKTYGGWFIKQLKRNVNWFFHQTQHSTALAKGIGLKNSITTGDTRFDRVRRIPSQDIDFPLINEFKGDHKAIVFGSSWATEERIAEMVVAKDKQVRIVMVPHDLKRVCHLQEKFPTAVLYSQIVGQEHFNFQNSRILIIDCIGLLSKLYFYGDLAVVGGGFHAKGLHNILEAATYGIPVFFGNQYKKNPEADDLIAKNGARSFEDEFFAGDYLTALLQDDISLKKMGDNARKFIVDQPYSSKIIVQQILKKQNS